MFLKTILIILLSLIAKTLSRKNMKKYLAEYFRAAKRNL